MIEIRISGVKRWQAKTKKIGAYARGQYAPDVVKEGYKFVQKIAPRQTGALLRAVKKEKSGKQSAKLVSYTPNHADGRQRPYHLWMHDIPAPARSGAGAGSGYKTSGRIRSGEPMFMYAAQDYMKSIAGETFKKKLKKL